MRRLVARDGCQTCNCPTDAQLVSLQFTARLQNLAARVVLLIWNQFCSLYLVPKHILSFLFFSPTPRMTSNYPGLQLNNVPSTVHAKKMNATCKCWHTSGFARRAGCGSSSCFRGFGPAASIHWGSVVPFSVHSSRLASVSLLQQLNFPHVMQRKGLDSFNGASTLQEAAHFMSAEDTGPFWLLGPLGKRVASKSDSHNVTWSVFYCRWTIQGSVQYRSAHGNDTAVSLNCGCCVYTGDSEFVFFFIGKMLCILSFGMVWLAFDLELGMLTISRLSINCRLGMQSIKIKWGEIRFLHWVLFLFFCVRTCIEQVTFKQR